MKIKPGYIIKQVANQTIVVPTGQEAINFNGIIHLNESGKLLFEALENECESKDLVDLLMTHYEIDSKTAAEDVAAFVKTLKDKNILS